MPTDRTGPRASILPALAAILLATLAGCAGGPAGSPTPSASPGASAPAGAIDHATGATDLVLRMDEGGGFVPPSFFLSQGPLFSLYGDGTIIVRAVEPAPLATDGIGRSGPYLAVRLDEAAVQDLLAYAIGDGGLRAARDRYDSGRVADVGTTSFTLDAGGIHRTVAVVGLGMDVYADTPDAAAVAALDGLRTRLVGYASLAGATPWVPDRYRGILTENPVDGVVARPWPWPAVSPAEFVADAPGAYARTRTLTPEEAAALGVSDYLGGIVEVDLRGPDGAVYAFHLRPLWPDEAR